MIVPDLFQFEANNDFNRRLLQVADVLEGGAGFQLASSHRYGSLSREMPMFF